MKSTPNVSAVIKNLLSGLDTRQKAVLEGRYGIMTGEAITLAKLGEEYGITRERVRQIESLALDSVRSKPANEEFRVFVELVENYLKNAGGVKRESDLLKDLRALLNLREGASVDNQIRFLLEATNKFKFSKDGVQHYAFWYLTEEDKKKAIAFGKDLIAAMKASEEEILKRGGFGRIFAEVLKNHNLKESVGMNYAAAVKKFSKNVYGEYGLSGWSEVNPKTARDWAHLVLRKEKKPLHFTKIADIVNNLRSAKRVHHQTIHNELIKDDKFVLVGKGMYGLREFGLVPGTAREVIAHLLKKNGPLSPDDVVNRITSERFLKPNTILINLQNKKHFERLDDGRYTIKEA